MLSKRASNNLEERLLSIILIIFVLRGVFFVWMNAGSLVGQSINIVVYSIFVLALYFKPDKDGPSQYIHLHFGLLVLIVFGFNYRFDDADFLYYIIIIQFITSLTVRQSIVWFPIFSSAIIFDGIVETGVTQGIVDGLSNSTLVLFMIILGNALGRARRAQEESTRLLGELSDANQKLKQYAAQIEEFTIAEERNRLSRDLHDTLGHRLTVSIVQLEGAEYLIASDPERATQRVHKVGQQLSDGLSELRQTVAMLRTPTVIDLSLPLALKQLAQNFSSATNLNVKVSVPDSLSPLSDASRMTLYRVAQEALTNIQRHAQAQEAQLSLKTTPTTIELCVSDNGVGPTDDMESKGFGLRGMRERVQKIGGELNWSHNGDSGTILNIQLPINSKEVTHAG